MAPDNDPLLSAAFLRRLEALRLLLRRGAGGAPSGGRATRRKGGMIEFESHRDYAPGDDPRTVDWFAYARTGRLVVKEFARDEVVKLRVLLDRSASMGADDDKWRRALEVSAALAALALFAHSVVELFVTGDRRLERVGGAEAESGLQALLRALERVEPTGAPSPVHALREARNGPWATALVSDLLDPAEPRTALATPATAGFGETICVHLLARDEAHPAEAGALALRDVESGRILDCVADDLLVDRYRRELAAHRDRWQRAAVASGARYVFATSDEPVEAIVARVVNPLPVRGAGP